MKKYKFNCGIIGAAGRIGSQLEDDRLREHPCTHLGSFKSHPDIIVEAICDLNILKLEEVAKLWGVPYIYVDYRIMLRNRNLDIISVATPVETHRPIMEGIIEETHTWTNKPLIFCEKPLAESPYEAEKMVNACKDAGIILMTNHTRRWHNAYNNAKQLMPHPKKVVAYVSGDPFNDGIHAFDLLNFYGAEENVYIPIKSDYLIFEVELFNVSTRIRIINNGRYLEEWQIAPSEFYENYYELHLQSSRSYKDEKPMLRAIENIVAVLKGEAQPACTGQMGLEALCAYTRWKIK